MKINKLIVLLLIFHSFCTFSQEYFYSPNKKYSLQIVYHDSLTGRMLNEIQFFNKNKLEWKCILPFCPYVTPTISNSGEISFPIVDFSYKNTSKNNIVFYKDGKQYNQFPLKDSNLQLFYNGFFGDSDILTHCFSYDLQNYYLINLTDSTCNNRELEYDFFKIISLNEKRNFEWEKTIKPNIGHTFYPSVISCSKNRIIIDDNYTRAGFLDNNVYILNRENGEIIKNIMFDNLDSPIYIDTIKNEMWLIDSKLLQKYDLEKGDFICNLQTNEIIDSIYSENYNLLNITLFMINENINNIVINENQKQRIKELSESERRGIDYYSNLILNKIKN